MQGDDVPCRVRGKSGFKESETKRGGKSRKTGFFFFSFFLIFFFFSLMPERFFVAILVSST